MKLLLNSIALTVCLLSSPAGAPGEGPVEFDPTPFLGKRWYGVYLMSNKVGYGSSEITRATYGEENGYRATFSLLYRVSLLGQPHQMAAREERTYLPNQGLAAFSSENDSALGRTVISGVRKGDGFEVSATGGKKLYPALPEKLADYLAPLLLVRKKAPVGEKLESVQFMPTFLKSVRAVHTVEKIEKRFIGGVKESIYHVKSAFPELGIETVSLIDRNLNTLEASVGGILTIREEGEAEAKNLSYGSDLILLTSITPDRPVPSPQETRSLSLKLRGLKDPALIISSPRQQFKELDDGSLLLRIERRDFDPQAAPRLPVSDPDLKEFLEPTLYIQSDDPTIEGLARKIAGGETNSYLATGKLVDWVYENLGKSFLAAIPNAIDVLKKKSGDCKAHSVLFTALARSLGLPARQVSGLVQTPDGKFYYHQWAEVHLGRWHPVDPVFGQTNADATHLKLSQGDLADQIKLLNLIGNIGIEVLESPTKK